jgi:hypothetical protein
LVGIPLTGLASPHFCARPKPGSGFPMPYAMVFFMFNEMRLEVIVRFVDIGGIVDHHSLKLCYQSGHKYLQILVSYLIKPSPHPFMVSVCCMVMEKLMLSQKLNTTGKAILFSATFIAADIKTCLLGIKQHLIPTIYTTS